mmetsp:Transcript_21215/g.44194  ORF Transcript_21215/g.44194 Transcript_21215/m.44194 type:complete len:221 (-) Transcript_21215:2854-3516(-)
MMVDSKSRILSLPPPTDLLSSSFSTLVPSSFSHLDINLSIFAKSDLFSFTIPSFIPLSFATTPRCVIPLSKMNFSWLASSSRETSRSPIVLICLFSASTTLALRIFTSALFFKSCSFLIPVSFVTWLSCRVKDSLVSEIMEISLFSFSRFAFNCVSFFRSDSTSPWSRLPPVTSLRSFLSSSSFMITFSSSTLTSPSLCCSLVKLSCTELRLICLFSASA